MVAVPFFVILLSLFSSHAIAQLQSSEAGYISALISEKGLVFAKDVLVEQAIRSLTPLSLPDIGKSIKIPLIGSVHATLSNITLSHIDVSSSTIQTGESGIVIVASGAAANLSMNWRYSYSTWLVPIEISDKGEAFIEGD